MPLRRLAIAALLVVSAVGGGLAVGTLTGPSADADGSHRFAWPTRGGVWTLRNADGSEVRLELVASKEPVADGTSAEVPVLRLEATEGSGYLVHQVDRRGIRSIRGEWNSTVSGPIFPDERFPADYVNVSRNLLVRFVPADVRWTALGPGLWGRTLEVGETLRRPIEPEWKDATIAWTLTDVEDGCAVVEAAVEGLPPGSGLDPSAGPVRSRFCDDPVPERIRLADGGEVSLRETARGAALPEPVAPSRARPVAFDQVPPDRSSLPLPLETAAEAVRSHPATGAWLADHPDAVAVRGEFKQAGCPRQPCVLDQGPDRPVHRWTLNWTTREGEWLSVTVASPRDADPAAVADWSTGQGPARDAVPDRVVPLADALEVRRRVDVDDWRLQQIVYDLTTSPAYWEPYRWVPHEVDRPTNTGFRRVSLDIHASDGTMQGGWIPRLG